MSQEPELSPSIDRATRLESALYPAAARLLALVVGVVILSVFALPAFGIELPDFSRALWTMGFNAINMAGLMGIYVLYLCARPGPSELRISIIVALLIEAFLYTIRPAQLSVLGRLNLLGIGFAVVGFAGMILLAFRARGSARRRVLGLLSVSGVLMLYGSLSVVFLGFLSHLTPTVFDAYVYHIESALGLPLPVIVARLLESHPFLDLLTTAVYMRLTLFIAIGFYLNLRYPKATTSNLIAGFLLALFLCFPLYLILPMVGINMFIGIPPWPHGPPPTDYALKWVAAPSWMPRTCAPSLHGTWVYLFFFSVYRLGPTAAGCSLLVVVLTVLGTMSTSVGHYFIDLVLAVPLAVAVQATVTFPTATNARMRATLAVAGLAFTVLNCSWVRLAPEWIFRNIEMFWLVQIITVIGFLRAEYVLGRRTLEE